MLKEILESKRQPHISSGKVSISGIGSCLRKKYSELKKIYKEEYNETMFRIFAQGDFFHQRLVSELIEKGPSSGYEVAAAECNIRNNQYISGRCDCILSHAPSKKLYIIDFKSCSPYAFNNLKKGIVSETYKNQVLLYMHIFHIYKGYLLFVNKASSEIEEFEVEYDQSKAEFLINRIKFFFENFVNKDILPPRCTGQPYGCKCCWPDGDNKPTSEQLEAVLKQQENTPELFKEFVPQPQPSFEAVEEPQEPQLDKKWVKV